MTNDIGHSARSASSSMPNSQHVHETACKLFEQSKHLRTLALASEVVALGVSYLVSQSQPNEAFWQLLAAFSLGVLAILVRFSANVYHGHAEESRTEVIQALASNVDVPESKRHAIDESLPPFHDWLPGKPTATALREYYLPQTLDSPTRSNRILCLLQCVYFSRSTMQRLAWLLLGVLLLSLGASFVFLSIALRADSASTTNGLLGFVFPIVLSFLSLRVFSYLLEALSASGSLGKVESEVAASFNDREPPFKSFVDDYRLALTTVPPVPTPFYRLVRRSVEKKWTSKMNSLQGRVESDANQ